MLNLEASWSIPKEAQIFSLGSIMRYVEIGCHNRTTGIRPIIWGTGCIGPIGREFVPKADFRLIRGPLTADMLNLQKVPYGDPGLILPKLYQPKSTPVSGRIGVLPHISQINAVKQMLGHNPNYHLISPLNQDFLSVVDEITKCEYLYSSSLHGLILADAYGIENTWLSPDGIHPHTARFKFYDYALSIGRVLGEPVKLDDLASNIASLIKPQIKYNGGIEDCIESLENTASVIKSQL
jgi:hypothetical protein